MLKGTHLTYFAKTDASSVSSAEWGEITHEGMLRKKKQGKKQKHRGSTIYSFFLLLVAIGKGWKNRWAQIRPEGLLYFKSQKDKEPIGALPFLECERVENPAEKSFEVTYNGVKYEKPRPHLYLSLCYPLPLPRLLLISITMIIDF